MSSGIRIEDLPPAFRARATAALTRVREKRRSLLQVAAVTTPPATRAMNKTEAAYDAYLEVLPTVAEHRYEAVTLRLAKRTRYTPDFMVLLENGRIEFHEVKGFWRDDARVKIKLAAEWFPWFTFRAITRAKQRWAVETITP